MIYKIVMKLIDWVSTFVAAIPGVQYRLVRIIAFDFGAHMYLQTFDRRCIHSVQEANKVRELNDGRAKFAANCTATSRTPILREIGEAKHTITNLYSFTEGVQTLSRRKAASLMDRIGLNIINRAASLGTSPPTRLDARNVEITIFHFACMGIVEKNRIKSRQKLSSCHFE